MEVVLRALYGIAGLVLGLLAASAASAQDEPEIFRLDPVFVSVFRSPDPALEERARRVEAGLREALAERHLVVAIDQVPGFEDYDAETYMLACPRDRWDGCAYVIADRGRADWAVSGVIARETPNGLMVQTTIIDVRDARTVVQFATSVDDADPGGYADAVASFIDRLAAGALVDEELLAEPTGPVEPTGSGMDRAEKAAIAAGLEALEAELGALDVKDLDRLLEAPRLTSADLDAYAAGEGVTPWARLDMTAAQYKRMRNGGFDVAAYEARLRGRAGRVLVRGGLVGGSGPFEVNTDMRWSIDASTSEVVRTEIFQEVLAGPSFGAFGEVGLGLLPWLDVSVFAHTEVGSLTWVLHPETLQDPRTPDEPTTQPAGAAMVGGRATVAFLPDLDVRPTVSGGLGLWMGPGLASAVDEGSVPAVRFPAPARVLVGVGGPGVELDASRQVQIFGRLDLALPLAGAGIVREQTGSGSLTFPGSPKGGGGVGVRVAAGIQASFGPLWGGADTGRPPDYDGAP